MKKITKKRINEFRLFINKHHPECYCQLWYDFNREKYFFYADFTKGGQIENCTLITQLCIRNNDYKKYSQTILIDIVSQNLEDKYLLLKKLENE